MVVGGVAAELGGSMATHIRRLSTVPSRDVMAGNAVAVAVGVADAVACTAPVLARHAVVVGLREADNLASAVFAAVHAAVYHHCSVLGPGTRCSSAEKAEATHPQPSTRRTRAHRTHSRRTDSHDTPARQGGEAAASTAHTGAALAAAASQPASAVSQEAARAHSVQPAETTATSRVALGKAAFVSPRAEAAVGSILGRWRSTEGYLHLIHTTHPGHHADNSSIRNSAKHSADADAQVPVN